MTSRTQFMVVAAAAALLAGAPVAEAKTFKYAFQGDAGTMDPHGLFETPTIAFLSNIYETLVFKDGDLKIIPGLAEKWEQTKPDTWRFNLRKGVKFHNGNPFTADDVVFSIARMKTPGSDFKGAAADVKEVVKIDDYTVDLVTPAPNPIFIQRMEDLPIMDKEWSEQNKTTEATSPKDAAAATANFANLNANGTGPFILKSREPGQKTVLTRNPNYWGKIDTNVDEVIFTPIAQDATRVAALLAGDVDMVYPVPVQDWERLEKTAGVKVLRRPETRTIFLGMDQDRAELLYSNVKGKNPFKDLKVRKAMYEAIDIDAINAKIMRGSARPTGVLVPAEANGYNAALDKRLPFNVDAAKKLMTEAGYPNGFEVTMDCPNDRYVNDEQICQAVVSMLAKINVKVTLLAQPKSKYFAKVLSPAFDTSFYLLGWNPSTGDAHDALSMLAMCRDKEKGLGEYNLGNWCNKRYTELVNAMVSETDKTKRQAMIDEATKIFIDDVGLIPLHQQPLSWGTRDTVTLKQRPDDRFLWKYVVMK